MLEDTSFSHVVSWGPQGDCFVVKDMNEFTKTILPRMFKHSNFASFVRQLNKYDFHKVRHFRLSLLALLSSFPPSPPMFQTQASLTLFCALCLQVKNTDDNQFGEHVRSNTSSSYSVPSY